MRVETDKGMVCIIANKMDRLAEWRFGVAANITHSHLDDRGELCYGTKAFMPGTKVYLGGKFCDNTNSQIGVIGVNRFGRIVVESVSVDLIEKVRPQRIYKPKVLAIMSYLESMDGWEWWKKTAADRKDTERFAKEWSRQ